MIIIIQGLSLSLTNFRNSLNSIKCNPKSSIDELQVQKCIQFQSPYFHGWFEAICKK